jgi:hypothetical protein
MDGEGADSEGLLWVGGTWHRTVRRGVERVCEQRHRGGRQGFARRELKRGRVGGGAGWR